VPDSQVALVELLAYVGDQLSYHQDAVATEAYLDTARLRISVRRHARLVDYALHEGCNARAWVCLEVDAPCSIESGEACFVSAPETLGLPSGPLDCRAFAALPSEGTEVFEPCEPRTAVLHPELNRISLWTWGMAECCLPTGATTATLKDAWAGEDDVEAGERRERVLSLAVGDVLVFEELRGPVTGEPADADPTHRQAVRLTAVTPAYDALYDQPVLEVEWAQEDALGFPLCLSSLGGEDCRPLTDVSVARGNVILVDHGASIDFCDGRAEPLGSPDAAPDDERGCFAPCQPRHVPGRALPFRPSLARGPVTHSAPFPVSRRLAERQAELVAAIPQRARRRFGRLLDAARDGQALDRRQLDELRILLGARALAESGLTRLDGGEFRTTTAADQADALERLSGRFGHLVRGKQRRTRHIVAQLHGGYSLDRDAIDELRELWGARYADAELLQGAPTWGPASAALDQDPRDALPVVRCEVTPSDDRPGLVWHPVRDLLSSGPADAHFVGEVDDEGRTWLRFGEAGASLAPESGRDVSARYRVGNGAAGNVGPEAISRVVLRTLKAAPIRAVRNPLAARGGTEPEAVAHAKLLAPGAFRDVLARAITRDDYANLAEDVARVHRAAGRLRWTGSWYEALVGVDAAGAEDPSEPLLEAVRARLTPPRRIGHDLHVVRASKVPIELAVLVCVEPDYQRAHVHAAVLDVLSNRVLPDGTQGFFHPDRQTFGEPVRVSAIAAAVQSVPGVGSTEVMTLRRQFEADDSALRTGVLPVGPLEVPELLGDPNEPERGVLRLECRGGR
jgi:predicted phage baseplate assembly protein